MTKINRVNNSKTISDLEDLNNHGVTDIIPPGSEYYTTDLRRGSDSNANDLPDFDIGGNNPLDENQEEVFINTNLSTSSNAGGTIRQKDIITNNVGVPGEPGHPGIDEDTG